MFNSRPSDIASQLAIGANLITTTRTLAFKDAECTGKDMSWDCELTE
ncbi:hypothetical protein H8L32_22795 [Undibacterium sp. CY18W]|uniref:Uncharacterized protein n=1 Tax=Undibacterium hunanense TaxID=2762292 RepID=A0ABR6ZWQ9_9BURK|nr:hypothetical protein [Undibacterium hunanense]MBC3920311.1 hypothetical protein [Undibacterium hunanense]